MMTNNKNYIKKDKTPFGKKETGMAKPLPQPKWNIDADLTKAQFVEACKLLEAGMKVRRVALKFGIHKNKIRRIL